MICFKVPGLCLSTHIKVATPPTGVDLPAAPESAPDSLESASPDAVALSCDLDCDFLRAVNCEPPLLDFFKDCSWRDNTTDQNTQEVKIKKTAI